MIQTHCKNARHRNTRLSSLTLTREQKLPLGGDVLNFRRVLFQTSALQRETWARLTEEPPLRLVRAFGQSTVTVSLESLRWRCLRHVLGS